MITAAVLPAPGQPVELRELPEPELQPGAALLAVEASEVCGTDVHLQDGRLDDVPYPLVPGHVSVGRLARIRGTLRDIHGRVFREGDRVTFLDVHGSCNACWTCLVARATTRCPKRRVYGITYGVADGPSGGWAQAMVLKPGTRVIGLDDVEPELFMAAGCALPTSLHAMQRAPLQLGSSVLVFGCGPVGLMLVLLARQRGAERVLCIGGPEHRLHHAREAGAMATLDFAQHDAARQLEWAREHTHGHGADVTFEATGDPRAVVQAMRATRDAGTVVVLGQYTDGGDVSFNPHHDLNRKHLDVRGCWGSDYEHFDTAARWLRQPEAAAALRCIERRSFSLQELDTALALVRRGELVKALVTPAA